MKQTSNKQAAKNRQILKIKKSLFDEHGEKCMICKINRSSDLMHILPKSLWPEYYTEKWNFILGCRSCHDMFDSSAVFRRKTGLYQHVKKHDENAAWRYFQMNNAENDL